MRQEHLKLQSLSHVLISHMHGDHYLGLVGLLSSMNLLGRTKEITLIGPEHLEDLVTSHCRYSGSKFQYPIHFQVTDHTKSALIYESSHLLVKSFPLMHRVPTTGFHFQEKTRPRKLIKKKLEFFNVPIKQRVPLTMGEDFITEEGEIIPNERLTTDPPKPTSYAYCSDTGYFPSVVEHVKGCDLLYHEATFMDMDAARAKKTQHSTARQAAMIAKEAEVDQLLLGHYSARYRELDELLAQAKEVFPQSRLAEEGLVIDIDKDC
jgi:ribonuclease Z